jgi:hypothetical protein
MAQVEFDNWHNGLTNWLNFFEFDDAMERDIRQIGRIIDGRASELIERFQSYFESAPGDEASIAPVRRNPSTGEFRGQYSIY